MNPWGDLLRGATPAAPERRPAYFKQPKFKPGDRVGLWTLLEFTPGTRRPVRKPASWLCRCDCGTERSVYSDNLTGGLSKSCGCAPRPRWHQMKEGH